MGLLEAMNIRCARVSEVPCSGEVSSVIVANSADLGFHKASTRFWGILKAKMGITDLAGLILVDDFGYNEEKSARYSDRHKVKTRENETVKVLREVFQTDIHVAPFMLESIRDHGLNGLPGDLYERYGHLIEKKGQAIEGFLLVAGGR
jgi:hypothetical protein